GQASRDRLTALAILFILIVQWPRHRFFVYCSILQVGGSVLPVSPAVRSILLRFFVLSAVCPRVAVSRSIQFSQFNSSLLPAVGPHVAGTRSKFAAARVSASTASSRRARPFPEAVEKVKKE
ncbi:hypothetical protein T310_6232, partial [Rasamsonia emersonii CBS 393.64]